LRAEAAGQRKCINLGLPAARLTLHWQPNDGAVGGVLALAGLLAGQLGRAPPRAAEWRAGPALRIARRDKRPARAKVSSSRASRAA